MTSDPKYPIYHVAFRWACDGKQDDKYPNWHTGLPEGRVWNGTSFLHMLQERVDVLTVNAWAKDEWWTQYPDEKKKNPSDLTITVTPPRLDTWCLSWFEHWTFDDGRTDEGYLDSFQRYVNRHRYHQDTNDPDYVVCLMGAEDRWRWHAGPEPKDRNPPPCRCEYCKKLGIIRIAH